MFLRGLSRCPKVGNPVSPFHNNYLIFLKVLNPCRKDGRLGNQFLVQNFHKQFLQLSLGTPPLNMAMIYLGRLFRLKLKFLVEKEFRQQFMVPSHRYFQD
jgi:hypothetical protein